MTAKLVRERLINRRQGACKAHLANETGVELMLQAQEPPQSVEPKPRGRQRSIEAEAAILKATLSLLERKPLRRVTADAIAHRAGVSKATIYKWWPSKNQVALDAYLTGMTERVLLPNTGSAELDFSIQLKSLTAFYTTPLGRLFCQFIAEGQSDPAFLALFRERFLYTRRNAARVMLRRGIARGEINEEIDGEIVLDLVYGPTIFRLLAGHGPLNDLESEAMIRAVFSGIRRPASTCQKKASGKSATSNNGSRGKDL